MKRLWMPLYVGDYLADTGHLTTVQHGAYLLLIMHYWMKARLPSDEKQLMAIARLCQSDWDSNREVLASFFEPGWRHPRIDAELAKARSLSEKRSLAGLKGAWIKHGHVVANAKQKPTQSQSHIERPTRAISSKAEQVAMLRELLTPAPAVTPQEGEKTRYIASPELIQSLRKRGSA